MQLPQLKRLIIVRQEVEMNGYVVDVDNACGGYYEVAVVASSEERAFIEVIHFMCI